MSSLLKLTGAIVYDPAHVVNGAVRDLYIRDGRLVAAAQAGAAIDREIDCSGKIIMAGAIDLHTHIGGGKVNIARLLMAQEHRDNAFAATEQLRAGAGGGAATTSITGYRYAELGYTACFEPAMLPINARHAHLEMADVPMVDRGAYAMLGNDDYLLQMMAGGREQASINDYVAWTINATQAIGLKVVNPGGISAFKFNQRKLDVDEAHTHYGVTPRSIVRTLAQALHDLQVPHPLHVHGSNLGVAGNDESTLALIDAAEGLPIHLTHIQFHSYGKEGDRKFSSGAARIAEAINRNRNISADVGQIMFGRTVTTSGDSQAQHRGMGFADPRRAVLMDIECDAGCGVVPFRYKDSSFVNALQWAIGLEMFLLVDDPWRIFLTTDHPNGAPFTSYPRLIKLLMDRDFRNQQFAQINADAQKMSSLGGLNREYSLYEIAIMTRAAPARILGLADRGHLGVGAAADIVVYQPNDDPEVMFGKPAMVFKDGELIVRDGQIERVVFGNPHVVRPHYDKRIERELSDWFDRTQSTRLSSVRISDDELCACGHGARIVSHACQRGRFHA